MRAVHDTCVKYHYKYNISDQETAHAVFKYLESSGEIKQYALSRERIVYTLMFGSFPPMELSPLAILLSAGINENIKSNHVYNRLSKTNDTGFNTYMWNYITNRSNIDCEIFERLLCESPNEVDRFYANNAFKNFMNSGFKRLTHMSKYLDQNEMDGLMKSMMFVVNKLLLIYKSDIDPSCLNYH